MRNGLGSGQEVALRLAALESLACQLKRLWESGPKPSRHPLPRCVGGEVGGNRWDGSAWIPSTFCCLALATMSSRMARENPARFLWGGGGSPLPAGISNFTKSILDLCNTRFGLICGYCSLLCCSASDYLGSLYHLSCLIENRQGVSQQGKCS